MLWAGHTAVEEAQYLGSCTITSRNELLTLGNTGNARSASPHLHFEIHTEKEKVVDPLPYISSVNP